MHLEEAKFPEGRVRARLRPWHMCRPEILPRAPAGYKSYRHGKERRFMTDTVSYAGRGGPTRCR
jgi:hypothetical protein